MTTIQLMNPQYKEIEAYIASIPETMETSGETIQDGRNLIKQMTAPDGRRLCVKRYHKPHGLNAAVYSWHLRMPKGMRAYTYAQRLLEAGIDTPEPVAYLEERSLGFMGYSYFVSLMSDYPHKMYEWGDAPKGTYEALPKPSENSAPSSMRQVFSTRTTPPAMCSGLMTTPAIISHSSTSTRCGSGTSHLSRAAAISAGSGVPKPSYK